MAAPPWASATSVRPTSTLSTQTTANLMTMAHRTARLSSPSALLGRSARGSLGTARDGRDAAEITHHPVQLAPANNLYREGGDHR
jgi:hypothetical protein